MRISVRCSAISRLATAAAALWLGAGPAWAGGGGESVGSLQSLLGNPNGTSGLCELLGMTSCPQLPTLTQLVLEFSALVNSPPDLVRSPQAASLVGGSGICTVA